MQVDHYRGESRGRFLQADFGLHRQRVLIGYHTIAYLHSPVYLIETTNPNLPPTCPPSPRPDLALSAQAKSHRYQPLTARQENFR